jgi:beta-lactamase superfamily II metal-dependent hydrolase
MAGQLLVRVYNIGLGDCIYLRVPDSGRDVSILIDCGNKFNKLEVLGKCIEHLKKELPDAGHGKKRLDLLVVSHPHEDHHKGFEEEFLTDIQIDHIWLSPAFDMEYPQAKGFHALRDAAARAINALESLSGLALGEMSEEVRDVLSLSKSEALEMLNDKLPKLNGILPEYVTADTPKDKLKIFTDSNIKLKVLAPMGNIDGYYLGGEGLVASTSGMTPEAMVKGYEKIFPDLDAVEAKSPQNISTQDFKLLRSRIQANALAAAAVAGHVENNLSVVLLLEWHGRRLLFSGDAEWSEAHNGAVQAGSSNGSWNVMWQERKADLSQSLDFYKIGHHGSENATPWKPPDPITGKEHPINAILNKLLPIPAVGEKPHAYAVASTERTKRWPSIPNAALLKEIGKRVANARPEYVEKEGPKSVEPHVPQPQRTDLEEQVTQTPNKAVDYIELSFDPD